MGDLDCQPIMSHSLSFTPYQPLSARHIMDTLKMSECLSNAITPIKLVLRHSLLWKQNYQNAGYKLFRYLNTVFFFVFISFAFLTAQMVNFSTVRHGGNKRVI